MMSRPNYLPGIMTSGVIRGIREEQAYYDQDPERYERNEARKREECERELSEESCEQHNR